VRWTVLVDARATPRQPANKTLPPDAAAAANDDADDDEDDEDGGAETTLTHTHTHTCPKCLSKASTKACTSSRTPSSFCFFVWCLRVV